MYNSYSYNYNNHFTSVKENINNVVLGNIDENCKRDFQPKTIKLRLLTL